MQQPTPFAMPPDQAWADEFLTTVRELAMEAGRMRGMRPERREDIAQDIVLHYLKRIRDGRLTEPPAHLVPAVRRAVRQRAISRHRAETARSRYEGEYAPEVIENQLSWSDPVEAWRRRELEAMRPRVLARLPERRRRAYELVREHKLSYSAAGKVLGLDRKRVKAEVAAVDEEIRRALPPREAAA